MRLLKDLTCRASGLGWKDIEWSYLLTGTGRRSVRSDGTQDAAPITKLRALGVLGFWGG